MPVDLPHPHRVRRALGRRDAQAAARARSRARSSSTTTTVKDLGERIGEQTGHEVELSSRVDPDILGGVVLRVGNSILDASIKNRLEQLRKQVAQA